jgi:Flp pilus assembly protein TadG
MTDEHSLRSVERHGAERGLAMVEFTIVLPVVLLVLMATAELGRALYQYNTLQKSVRDAVRYVADHAFPAGTAGGEATISGTVETAAKNLVMFGSMTDTGTPPVVDDLGPDDVDVQAVTVGAEAVPLHVRVTATYDYAGIFGAVLPTFGFGPGIATDFTFTASSTMRALQ